MPSSIRMLGKLAAKGQSWDGAAGGAGADAIRPEDVAGALAGLGRGPYLVGRLVYAQDNGASAELVELLAGEARQLFAAEGWKTDYARGIAQMVLFELLWPPRCPDCGGEGKYTAWYCQLFQRLASGHGKPVVHTIGCARCSGKGRGELSQRDAARVAGIELSRYNRTWRERAGHIRRIVDGWEDDCLRHVSRQFVSIDEAS